MPGCLGYLVMLAGIELLHASRAYGFAFWAGLAALMLVPAHLGRWSHRRTGERPIFSLAPAAEWAESAVYHGTMLAVAALITPWRLDRGDLGDGRALSAFLVFGAGFWLLVRLRERRTGSPVL